MPRTPDDVEAARVAAEDTQTTMVALRRTAGIVLERVLAGTMGRAEIDVMCRRVVAAAEAAGRTLRAVEQLAAGGGGGQPKGGARRKPA